MKQKTIAEIEALADEHIKFLSQTQTCQYPEWALSHVRDAFIFGYLIGTKHVMTEWVDQNAKELEEIRSQTALLTA